MKTVKLNNGIEAPIIGMGINTFGKVDKDYYGDLNGDTKEIEWAIASGYRYFDTAVAYRNEALIGDAIKKTGIAREDIFVVSKIPGQAPYIDSTQTIQETIDQTLITLQSDYVDCYLIHHPWDDLEDMLRVWQVLEDNVDNGKIKTIGVSNFNQEQLQYLIDHGRIKPAVNQVESHPSNWNHEIIEYGMKHGVIAQAWAPLKRIPDETMEVLKEMAKKYNKSWAQVVLNFQVNRNVMVIPKSHNEQRQKENLEIFDFVLSQEDTDLLYTL